MPENKEIEPSTNIYDYITSEEVNQALSNIDIREELIENIEDEIIKAIENSEIDYQTVDDDTDLVISNYFESDEFIDDFIKESDTDISFIPNEIISRIVNVYLLSNNNYENILFSLRRKKNFTEFKTLKFNNEIYIDPYIYLGDIIPLIPLEYINLFAKKFWRNIPDIYVNGPYDFNPKRIEVDGERISIYINKDALAELASDMRIAYFEEKSDDPGFISNFLSFIEEDYPSISNSIRELITKNNLTNEEQIDLIRLFFDQDNKIEMDNLIERVSEFLNTKNIQPKEILSIPKEVIKNWGIKKGTFYENAPWTVYNLKATELFGEGTDMRLCLSDPDMGYYTEVMNENIEIWSIRNNNGKRRFTIEIDAKFRDAASPEEKGKLVYQVKGKANRLPGYAKAEDKTIVFFDEIVFLMNLFYDLGIDVLSIEEMKSQVLEITKLNEDGLLSSKL